MVIKDNEVEQFGWMTDFVKICGLGAMKDV